MGKGLQIERPRRCYGNGLQIERSKRRCYGKGLQIERSKTRCYGNGLQIDRLRRGNGLQIDSITNFKKPKFLGYHISNFDIIKRVKYLKTQTLIGYLVELRLK